MHRRGSRRSHNTDCAVVVVDIEESGWLEDDASRVSRRQDNRNRGCSRLVLDNRADTLFVRSRRRKEGHDACADISSRVRERLEERRRCLNY